MSYKIKSILQVATLLIISQFFSLEALSSEFDPVKFAKYIHSLQQTGNKKSKPIDQNWEQTTYQKFYHGPILENEDKKYGIEYIVELRGLRNVKTGQRISEHLLISVIELTYCNFQYTKPEDYRFRRRTFKLSIEGHYLAATQLTRTYHPADNDGICQDSYPGMVRKQTLELSEELTSPVSTWLSRVIDSSEPAL